MKRIHVRLTSEIETKLKKDSEIAQTSQSEVIRKALQGLEITPPIPQSIISAIAGFGRNLNQLARHANSGIEINIYQIEQLRKAAAGIISELQKISKK